MLAPHIHIIRKSLFVSEPLIPLNSGKGRKLLKETDFGHHYMELCNHFVTQENLTYCGIASACMVLNALGIERPESPEHAPYRLFTQVNFFTPAVSKITSRAKVAKEGLTLSELGAALRTHSIMVDTFYADDCSLEEFRKQAGKALITEDGYVLVNYDRTTIGQEGAGHYSPIAAYNRRHDMFLIMDVSRYCYTPVWVKASRLWMAMNTKDKASGKSRGCMVIRGGYRKPGDILH